MKKALLLAALSIICSLSSCSIYNRYTYVTTQPLEVYGISHHANERYEDIPSGSTLISFYDLEITTDPVYSKESGGSNRYTTECIYKNYHVRVPKIYTGTKRKKKKWMSKRQYVRYLNKISFKPQLAFHSSYNIKQVETYQSPSSNSYTPRSSENRYSTPTTGAPVHTGPRGGRYYYNSNGNKTYIRRK